MNCIEVEPLGLSRNEDILAVVRLTIGDVWIDGKILLCEFLMTLWLLFGSEKFFSLTILLVFLLISMSP